MRFPISIKDVSLIGIHGPLNGGKDTCANYLQTKFPESFARYAFARPLKKACVEMFGFTQEQLEDRVLKETVDPFWGFTPRKAMQLLGSEYGRDMLRPDVWIKRAELEVVRNAKRLSNTRTLITDVRYPNEAEWLRSQPRAILIYLEVPNLVRDDKYQHSSEAGIERKDTDAYILNDKSEGLSALFLKLDQLFIA